MGHYKAHYKFIIMASQCKKLSNLLQFALAGMIVRYNLLTMYGKSLALWQKSSDIWAPLKAKFIIIASMMPLFEHSHSWLVDGFIMTLSMVISAFNYAMQNPIIQKDRLLEFTAYSGRLIVCHMCNEFHFSLTTQVPEFYLTFNADLQLEQPESDSGPPPDKQDPPSYSLWSDQCLIIPDVLFELPCPFCACPLLEWGQVVIQWYMPDLTAKDLQANPFFIHKIIWAGSPILLEQIYPDIHVPLNSLTSPHQSPPDTPPNSPSSSSSSQHAYSHLLHFTIGKFLNQYSYTLA